jgi:hypothetical protein
MHAFCHFHAIQTPLIESSEFHNDHPHCCSHLGSRKSRNTLGLESASVILLDVNAESDLASWTTTFSEFNDSCVCRTDLSIVCSGLESTEIGLLEEWNCPDTGNTR